MACVDTIDVLLSHKFQSVSHWYPTSWILDPLQVTADSFLPSPLVKEVTTMKTSLGTSMRAVLATLGLLTAGLPAIAQAEQQVADQERFGGEITVAIPASLPTLDMMSTTHAVVRQVGTHIWENLITFNDEFEVIPQLASSWEVGDDRRTFTFHLREGVQFHQDYGEVTAADVKASIERYREVVPAAETLGIESVTVVDPYTIEIVTQEPSGPAFLSLLASPSEAVVIMPEEIMAPVPNVGEISVEDSVGTGPYQLSEWRPGERIVLTRFEDYSPPSDIASSGFGGNRTAYLDTISLVPVPEPSARVAGLLAGDYHYAVDLPLTSLPQLEQDPSVTTVPVEPYFIPQAYLNLARPPFDNLQMRQAVFAAIDNEEILQAATRGNPDFFNLNCGSFFYENIQPRLHSDAGCELGLYGQGAEPDKARQLLEEAGYGGETITIITNTDYYWMYAAALVLAQQLGNVGIETTLEVYDWPGMLDRRADLDAWDISYSGGSLRVDPSQAYHWIHDTKDWTFYSEYDWPEMRELVEQDIAAETFDERVEIWQEIQQLVAENALMVNHGELKALDAHVNDLNFEFWYAPSFWDAWLD